MKKYLIVVVAILSTLFVAPSLTAPSSATKATYTPTYIAITDIQGAKYLGFLLTWSNGTTSQLPPQRVALSWCLDPQQSAQDARSILRCRTRDLTMYNMYVTLKNSLDYLHNN